MAFLKIEKFDLNNFYEKTPKPLKYVLVISLIIVGSYIFYAQKIDKSDMRQLNKIEESIETTYSLINKFDDFSKAQYVFNERMLEHLEDIYKLVEELNENTNKKLDLIIESGGSNTEEIIEKIQMLNETYQKLQEAYTPREFEKVKPIEKDTNLNDTLKFNIDVNKIKK